MRSHSPSVLLTTALFLTATAHLAQTADDPPKPIAIADVVHPARIDFEKEVLPILRANCIACHNAKDAKGELVLESPQTILKGGTSGAVVVPRESGKSRLLALAAHQKKPVMPPLGNRVAARPLAPEQLGLIKLWIDQGAGGQLLQTGPVQWQPLPPGVNPIFAVALTPDGKYAACSRANQIDIYDLPAGRVVARLSDPGIEGSPAFSKSRASEPAPAHLDFIRSLAFSPQGGLLASGSFRTVKLWRRLQTVRLAEATGNAAAVSVAVSPTGRMMAVGEQSGTIKLWELPAGKFLKDLTGHSAAVTGLAFSPNGSQLVSGALDKTVRAWKVSEGTTAGSFSTPAAVNALALLNGGVQIVTGEADNAIRIWNTAILAEKSTDAATAAVPLRELKGHEKPITALAGLANEKNQLLSGSEDGLLKLWDAESGTLLREFNHGAPLTAVAVRPDGSRFATAGADRAIKLWDAANGNMVAERRGDFRAANRISLAAGEVNFARASIDYRKEELKEAEELVKRQTAFLAEATKGMEQAEKTLAEKKEAAAKPAAEKVIAEQAAAEAAAALTKAQAAKKEAEIAAAKARDDGKQAADAAAKAKAAAEKEKEDKELAAASEAAEKTLVAAQSAQKAADEALKGAMDALRDADKKSMDAVKAAKDAAMKAKKSENDVNEAEAARTTAQSTVTTATQVLERDKETVPAAKNAIANAEAALAECETAKKASEEAAHATEKPFRALAFSVDNGLLAAAGEGQHVHLFEAQQLVPGEVLEGHAGAVAALAFTGDGRLVSAAADRRTFVWDAGRPWTLERSIGHVDDPGTLTDRVLKIDFSPDGKLLATAGGEPGRSGELKLWNVADGKLVREIPNAHRDTIFSVKFSPDGKHLATAAADRLARVFTVADGKPVHTFEGHTHHVLGVAWRADGAVLATCGGDNSLKVWNFETGSLVRTMKGDTYRIGEYRREVTSLAFIGSSEQLVATSGDKTVRLHRTSSTRDLKTLPGTTAFMHSAAVTPDGKSILAGGHDGVLRLWNGENGQLVKSFDPPGRE